MAKDPTFKDILYALEYLGDAMVRVPGAAGKAKWQMKTTGAAVKESVANEVRASGQVVAVDQRGGQQIIVWRSAA